MAKENQEKRSDADDCPCPDHPSFVYGSLVFQKRRNWSGRRRGSRPSGL